MRAAHRRRLPHRRLVAFLSLVIFGILGSGAAYAAGNLRDDGLAATVTAVPSDAPVIDVPTTELVPPSTTPPGTAAAAPSSTAAPSTYVVKPGDTLSSIAAWFKLHGYADLYQANRSVIGANPDLIHPGETITICAAGKVTVRG